MINPYRIIFPAILILQLIFQINSYSQLSGNYTIGSGGNYQTINSAVTDIVNNGVNGPVIFNIKPGKYYESVVIDSVKGTSLLNTVTFTSQSGIADDVSWFTNTQADNAFAVKINRADHLIFSKLTFSGDSVGNKSRRLAEIGDYSVNISFLGNKFYTNNTFISTTYLIYSEAEKIDNLKISGNSFTANGLVTPGINREGIRLYGNENMVLTEVSDNSFTDLTSSISINNSDYALIEKNVILMGNNSSINYGINLTDCDGLKILKNRITSAYSCGQNNPVGYSLTTYYCQNSLIANNFILFQGGSIAAFAISNYNQRYYYNTIASFGGLCPFNVGIYSCDSIALKNNIYVNFNTHQSYQGVPYTVFNSSVFSDHNNFNYKNTNIAKFNGQNVPGLQEWKLMTGEDKYSNEDEVIFISENDLHLKGESLSDYDLKGNPIAEVTDDIDGQPRDPYFPAMGGDEPFYPVNISVNLSMFTEGFYDEVTHLQSEDTINVFLRSVAVPYNIIDSCKALLISKGKASLKFFNAPTGNYYITVKHRNSMETWSKNGGESLVRDAYAAYDFTNSEGKAFGNNLILKGSKYCFYSGDVNQDGVIDLTDVLNIYNSAFSFSEGYVSSDVNGDSIVDLQDALIAYNNSVKFAQIKRPV